MTSDIPDGGLVVVMGERRYRVERPWGRFTEELARVLPRAAEAKVLRFLVVKEQKATFRCLPGAAAYRLPSETPLSNLFLAGDWTDTGWPATMEGALRSGMRASALIEAAEGRSKRSSPVQEQRV